MPGGRGDLVKAALKLNSDKHEIIAKAMKMSIDHGYRFSKMDFGQLGDAFDACDNPDTLLDLWCYAEEKEAVDWSY